MLKKKNNYLSVPKLTVPYLYHQPKNDNKKLIEIIAELQIKIKKLEERVTELEQNQEIKSIKQSPLPTPENSDLKDFKEHMKNICSYDNLE